MSTPPSDNGFSFILPWGILEWVVTGLLGAAATGCWWLLGLSRKVDRLEDQASQERAQMKVEIKKLEEKVERLTDKLEAVREELPSRQFIEGQLNNLGQRIDWTIANRAGVKTQP